MERTLARGFQRIAGGDEILARSRLVPEGTNRNRRMINQASPKTAET